MRPEITEVVAGIWPGAPAEIAQLTGGITNSNYKVEVGGEAFVVRVAGERTEMLGIDRASEVAAGRIAADLGIAPEIVHSDFVAGVVVTRFISGRPVSPAEVGEEPVISELAAALKRIHSAGSVAATFDTFKLVPGYQGLADAEGVKPPFDFGAMAGALDRIREARPWRPAALCHNDLLNSNLIHDGTIRIVDWEYAGMGDPFFDLGNLAVNHQFSPEQDEALLRLYFGSVAESSRATLSLFKLVSEAREAMWGVLQMALSNLDVDFGGYAGEHAEGFFGLLGGMDLDDTLARAASTSSDGN